MSETPSDETQGPNNAPSMRLLSQYSKDLSFENPGAPQTLGATLPTPAMEVAVDINARSLGQNHFEVELSVSATARREAEVVYVCEANYAGLFKIENVPADQLEPALLIEAPHMLFPFIRQIIASATRDGGFVALMLEPLDFVGMYQQQRMKREGAVQPLGTNSPAEGGNA
ncbi:MAG: protein-export chaperone SecB [Pseudomonadota bacterium]